MAYFAIKSSETGGEEKLHNLIPRNWSFLCLIFFFSDDEGL